MRFSLINLDDANESDEVYVYTPGGENVICAVPLMALDQLLPLLAEASADLPEFRCPACGGDPLGAPAGTPGQSSSSASRR